MSSDLQIIKSDGWSSRELCRLCSQFNLVTNVSLFYTCFLLFPLFLFSYLFFLLFPPSFLFSLSFLLSRRVSLSQCFLVLFFFLQRQEYQPKEIQGCAKVAEVTFFDYTEHRTFICICHFPLCCSFLFFSFFHHWKSFSACLSFKTWLCD